MRPRGQQFRQLPPQRFSRVPIGHLLNWNSATIKKAQFSAVPLERVCRLPLLVKRGDLTYSIGNEATVRPKMMQIGQKIASTSNKVTR